MAHPSSRSARDGDQPGTAPSQDAKADAMLAPVIAGAYARGMAETFDLLGVPAIFLDASGAVLFASRAALSRLQGPLRLRLHHLVAEHGADNQALAAVISEAVGDGREVAAARLPQAAVTLRVLPRTEAMARPGQLVRAVLLLSDDTMPGHPDPWTGSA